MIKQLYIMRENGILLYSHSNSDEQFNDDILIGFFASIANFSREALNTIIQNVDLGDNNKLVLYPIPEESLLAASIVSEGDNSDLIRDLMKDIIEDFIDNYAPSYSRESINKADMQKSFANVVGGRRAAPQLQRLLIAWLILGPLSVIIMLISSWLGDLLFNAFGIYQATYSFSEVLNRVIPSFFIIGTVVVLVIFVLPNYINGYFVFNKKLATFNSTIYFIVVMVEFFMVESPMFTILIAYIPVALIISVFLSSLGFDRASKSRLLDK